VSSGVARLPSGKADNSRTAARAPGSRFLRDMVVRLPCRCIPVRRAPKEEGGEMQVLLVSSRGGKGFGLPKVRGLKLPRLLGNLLLILLAILIETGWGVHGGALSVTARGHGPHACVNGVVLQGGWEDDESVEDAARRETIEEAGVRGTLEVRALMGFNYWLGTPARWTRRSVEGQRCRYFSDCA